MDGEGLLSIISLPQIENLGIRLLPHKKKLLQEIQTLRYVGHVEGHLEWGCKKGQGGR